MAKNLNDNDFKDCLKRGKIKEFSKAKSLIPKELHSAKSDLKTAQEQQQARKLQMGDHTSVLLYVSYGKGPHLFERLSRKKSLLSHCCS